MRAWILRVHRLSGLVLAVFLILLGVTGALLVWEEELDAALNPDQLRNAPGGVPLPPEVLIDRVMTQAHDGAVIDFLLYPRDPARSAILYVQDWVPAGADRQLNQVLVDRSTGQVLGARDTVSPRLWLRAEAVPWLYQFHYSLSAGRTGTLLLGFVALLWLLDCLIAWYLAMPRRVNWRRFAAAWLIERRRLAFDLHRAAGLWFGAVFVGLAGTGVYFNLYEPVFRPMLSIVSSVTPQPYQAAPLSQPVSQPEIGYARALEIARQAVSRRGARIDTLDYVSWNPRMGYYAAAFYTNRDLSRDAPSAVVYVNHDGSVKHLHLNGDGTLADIIIDWQFPLHSGQAFGLVGRVVVSVSGLVLVVLSVTGLVIWRRKLRARVGTVATAP